MQTSTAASFITQPKGPPTGDCGTSTRGSLQARRVKYTETLMSPKRMCWAKRPDQEYKQDSTCLGDAKPYTVTGTLGAVWGRVGLWWREGGITTRLRGFGGDGCVHFLVMAMALWVNPRRVCWIIHFKSVQFIVLDYTPIKHLKIYTCLTAFF